MSRIDWSDELGPRSRRPYLWIIHEGKITQFAGVNIEGQAVIVGTTYKKNGKWSHTTYTIQLGPNVSHLAWRSGWESNTSIEGVATALRVPTPPEDTWSSWAQMLSRLGVADAEAERIARLHFPKAANRRDEVASALAALGGAK